ncbi:MAG: branched-chain amino acid ABC transporter permease [Actinobacteria bacterium]|nr:MAG: branched-chain amino acid ABC transporter permease [Actinomycetota bacterium]
MPHIPILAQAATETNEFAKLLVEGLSLGSIYALLAMGFVIIFKATQVLNFAHGALASLGAFLVALFATIWDIPARWMPDAPVWVSWSLAVLIALVAAFGLGMLLERIFIRPMVGEELFAVAIVTLGVDIVVRAITNDFIGTDSRPLGDPWGTQFFDLGWVRLAHTEVAQFAITILLVIGVAWFFRTRTGIATRATAFDQEAARAQGIAVGRIFSLSWGIGAVLAAVAGVFLSLFPRRPGGLDTQTAFFAFAAFPAIVLGGLDSIVGAVVGGLIIGLAQSYSSLIPWEFLGSGFGGVVPYIVMLIVLLIRPYGLFGTEEIRRV